MFVAVEPGDSFSCEYDLPLDHPPGVYRYHPHHHGTIADQLFGGLYGVITVKGIDAIAVTRERIVVISNISLGASERILTPSNGTDDGS